eukprot:TRINITY_DN15444_c0_g1_i1.p1 TRINITY_DN15444_c0_g1~~TRINITY_DN15444_c0_g1_i1.p1  ORF type:complete len:206 (-),score=35.85 TRINITY_DN15444_c0_g1_i1:118-735(-)
MTDFQLNSNNLSSVMLEDNTNLSLEQWKAKRMLKEIEEYNGVATSLISFLIPPKTQLSKITQLLSQEYGTASGIKSRVTRQNVMEALKSIQARMKLILRIPERGLVIYCGVSAEDAKLRTWVFEPIKPLPTFVYRCDTSFLTQPVKDIIDASETKYGFIIVDGSGAVFASLASSSVDVLHTLTVSLPRKHNKGGQSSQRFARLRL